MIEACGACGAPVRVVATTSCSKLKLDPDPVEAGDIVIGEIAGVEVAVRVDPSSIDQGMPRYASHARTCTGTVGARREPRAARPHPFTRRNAGGNQAEEAGT